MIYDGREDAAERREKKKVERGRNRRPVERVEGVQGVVEGLSISHRDQQMQVGAGGPPAVVWRLAAEDRWGGGRENN